MLDLFPEGFAEERDGDRVELVAFTDEAGERRARAAFGDVGVSPFASGWEDEWKRFHVPSVVGGLWVGPPWAEPREGLTPIVIDPGRAFGTGGHATTRLCLELLCDLERGSVLDVGCGSGVLAISAAKLGFAPVAALDAEETAVEATRSNARLNHVTVDVRRGDALVEPLPKADVVLANLDLATVRALASRLECRLAVTSGYDEGERPHLAGLRHLERRHREGWAADLYARE
ncbi:MAG TPA: 50S ribosomal protein L11 methyltransferase [Gaiellaceae bacterium]|nr:50S ribosomal protein L11 methyltransferase [Gaiellaceae bacterium]